MTPVTIRIPRWLITTEDEKTITVTFPDSKGLMWQIMAAESAEPGQAVVMNLEEAKK